MAEPRRRLLALAAAVAAGLLVWTAAADLAWPARAMTTFLLALLPLLLTGQAAMADEVPDDVPRRLLYRTSAAALWLLAILTVLAARAGGFALEDLGVRTLDVPSFVGWTVVTTALGLAGLFAARALGVRERPLLRWLLPRSRGERLEFVGVAVTAGVTEELIFRGFLIPAVGLATSSWAAAVVVSSALFGYVHGYQGSRGALRAGVLGLVLALPFLATGSLLPSMAAHTLIDLAGGLWLADRLLAD